MLEERTAAAESVVRSAYEQTLANALPGRQALLAVGGFGRRELFPHSDIDLLLLVEFEQQIPLARETLSRFLQELWDAGLRPSHSVRTVEECLTLDDRNVELTISLLDRRFLRGNAELYQWLEERFARFERARGPEIARALAGLIRARHQKFQNTIYHLEPNIKEAPGGLRDLHALRWFGRLKPAATSFGEAREFLACLRGRLHEAARRDQNVLTFEAQEALSDNPAALMREYFRHARAIQRAVRAELEAVEERSSSLLQQFRTWRSRLSNADFSVMHDRVYLRSQPAGLAVFLFAARHGLELAADTLRRLSGYAPRTSWREWKQLLSLPRASKGLRAMQETGTLGALLPEWRNIECLVVRDFYHRYTVDEHTLVAIEALESTDDARFAGLFEEIEDPALLRLALLLHDIGKGAGDHAAASVRGADAVLQGLQAPEADRATVRFLVERHLELSSIMQARDLSDPSTGRLAAERVGTIERLKLLTMLTWADISAVHPGAMNPWRREQLWRLYLEAHGELTRELDAHRIHDLAASPERAQFLEGLPTRYVRTHTDAEIEAHLALARELAKRPVAIQLERLEDLWRLTLLTADRPFLLASAAGTLASFGMNILKAEAFANAQGVVLDTFTFADPTRTLELNSGEDDRLCDTLRRVLEGKLDVERLLRGRPRPPAAGGRALEPRVSFDNDASAAATLIEIVGQDRPGLLYELARGISSEGCNIEVVLIDTEAHKALDVFYATKDRRKLSGELQARLRTALLAICTG